MSLSIRTTAAVLLHCSRFSLVSAAAWLAGLPALAEESGRASWFTDVTAEVGVDFVHVAQPTPEHLLREVMAGGVAAFDANGDGLIDLLFTNGGQPGPQLYLQSVDGSFRNETTRSGLSSQAYGMGVALGDLDNDGDLDLYLTNAGSDQLFRNDGGTFRDITGASGIEASDWSTSATFCDLDLDGLLDLYVATYVRPEETSCRTAGGLPDYCPPNAYPATADRVFRNVGQGLFEDRSSSSGVSSRRAPGLGVVCHNLTGDPRPEVFVANDGTANHLWINEGDMQFSERAIEYGLGANLFGEVEAGMGVALDDLDGDSRLDLFLTHVDRETNTLYRATEQGTWLDATAPSGLGPPSLPFTGFGVATLDLELDGDLDLVVSNGRVRLPARSVGPSFEERYGERNQIFLGNARGQFESACPDDPFCAGRQVGRGLLAVDLDRDGDLDLVAANANGRASIFRNDSSKRGRWLAVRALENGRDALGARIGVEVEGRRMVRPILHNESYLSSRDATANFGLGDVDEPVRVWVTWPHGERESRLVTDLDRRIVLRSGEEGTP